VGLPNPAHQARRPIIRSASEPAPAIIDSSYTFGRNFLGFAPIGAWVPRIASMHYDCRNPTVQQIRIAGPHGPRIMAQVQRNPTAAPHAQGRRLRRSGRRLLPLTLPIIIVLGAVAALWYGGVLRHVSPIWIVIGLVIAVGLGIMLSVSGGKPEITRE